MQVAGRHHASLQPNHSPPPARGFTIHTDISTPFWIATFGIMAVLALSSTLFLLATVINQGTAQASPSAFTAPAGFPTSLFSSYYIQPAPTQEVCER